VSKIKKKREKTGSDDANCVPTPCGRKGKKPWYFKRIAKKREED